MNTQPKKQKIQGKKPSHRNAVLRSLLLELIRAERIQTTPRKAKFLKANFDSVVNKFKSEKDSAIAEAKNILRNEKAETKLVNKILPRLKDSNSGYVLSARTLPRKGDGAEQMIVMIKGAELQEGQSELAKALAKRGKTQTKKKDTSKNKKEEDKQTKNEETEPETSENQETNN